MNLFPLILSNHIARCLDFYGHNTKKHNKNITYTSKNQRVIRRVFVDVVVIVAVQIVLFVIKRIYFSFSTFLLFTVLCCMYIRL
jgi:hypothetical protein